MIKGLKRRLGIFFSFVGMAVLALFFTSDIVKQPNISYLFWGITFLMLGLFFMRSAQPDPEESQRFRLIRRIFSRKKNEDEEE